jgi:hypothetical protein
MLTLNDVCDRLMHIDEISLLELLEITSEDLVDRFKDRIAFRYDDLKEELDYDY